MKQSIPRPRYPERVRIQIVHTQVLSLSAGHQQKGLFDLDIYVDAPNHEDPEFCGLCGEFISRLLPPDVHLYGLHSPFPNEKPVLDALNELKRPFRHENRNLIFPLLSIPSDMALFSTGELMYFSLSFYMITSRATLDDISMPPRKRLFRDPWNALRDSQRYPLIGMISPDHPGCLISVQDSFADEKRITSVFQEVFPKGARKV